MSGDCSRVVKFYATTHCIGILQAMHACTDSFWSRHVQLQCLHRGEYSKKRRNSVTTHKSNGWWLALRDGVPNDFIINGQIEIFILCGYLDICILLIFAAFSVMSRNHLR